MSEIKKPTVQLNEHIGNIIFDKKEIQPEDKPLTLKEKIELSWKFLYEITELVINKFSKDDIKSANKLGYILLNNGMRYEHSVQLGIKQSLSKTKTLEQENLRTL